MLRAVRSFSTTASRSSLAKMTIVGRCTEFTENVSANGNKYLKYSLAVQPKRDGPTSWFNVAAFNEQQVNFMSNYVRKGAILCVEADAAFHTFEREDGSRGQTLSLTQREINLIVNGKSQEAAHEESA